METNEELEIILSCKNGKPGEFGLLYDAYVKKIYSFIYYKVQNKEAAEDLTSETFLKALDKINSFDPQKGKFSSWLYRIARNAVIDHFRVRKPHFPIENAWNLKDNTNIQADMETKEKIEKVKIYMQNLNEDQREIITLRVWQELSYKEISEILGKSEAGCKMMFFRAISGIRKEMPLLLALIPLVLISVGR